MRTRTKPKRRSSGRPSADRVGEERILAATLELLQTTHPAHVNRLEIARAAGVDPALIRYYFGTKDDLLARAIEALTQERIHSAHSLETSSGPARARLEDAVRVTFRSISNHPHYHALVLQELEHPTTSRVREARAELQSAGQRGLRSIVDQGIAEGEFRDVDTRFLEIALIGMCHHIVNAWPLFEELFDASTDRAETAEHYLYFVMEMVLAHLVPPSSANRTLGGRRNTSVREDTAATTIARQRR